MTCDYYEYTPNFQREIKATTKVYASRSVRQFTTLEPNVSVHRSHNIRYDKVVPFSDPKAPGPFLQLVWYGHTHCNMRHADSPSAVRKPLILNAWSIWVAVFSRIAHQVGVRVRVDLVHTSG